MAIRNHSFMHQEFYKHTERSKSQKNIYIHIYIYTNIQTHTHIHTVCFHLCKGKKQAIQN